MPRKHTDTEILLQKDHLYHVGIDLLKEKGLRKLTLEDITQTAQMAKGSFYHYYPSKEEYLYEVIKRNEKGCFDRMLCEGQQNPHTKEGILSVLETAFLSPDSLFGYLLPEELEYLVCHLPEPLQAQEMSKSLSNFQMTAKLLGLPETQENYSTLSYLMDSMQTVLRSSAYGTAGRENAVRIIAEAVAAWIVRTADWKEEKS